jgi:hypothetical protein
MSVTKNISKNKIADENKIVVDENKSRNETLTAELHFELFKQYA